MNEPASLTSTHPLTASFRDPAGSLFRYEGRILRAVNPVGIADLEAFLASASGQKLMSSGSVSRARALDAAECERLLADSEIRELYGSRGARMILEHERIDFPSFPYEWTAEMLYAAALLTLDLAQALLADGLGLKDATPYNILFRGPEPVFIDILSFERRQAGDPTWLPYAQFVRTFLLPLLANQAYGLGLDQLLTTRRDGLEPEEVYRWSKPLQRLKPPFFGLVSMPTWLGSRHKQDDHSIYQKKTLSDPEKARFILETVLNGLRRTLSRLQPAEGARSVWSDYMAVNNNYTADHFQAKQRFVGEALAEFPARSVLDVGCNTGHFSAIAARSGASVVAVDYDPVVLGTVWRQARAEKLDILPLAVNLTRPSPGTGWRNQECASFLDRARGKFEAVLMLAVIHHMLVTERVPLADIITLAAELTTKLLIIEYVAPEDSMFRRLTRGREELHRHLTAELFESHCRPYFDIVRVQHVEGATRRLYLLRKRA
uniref:Methyltransferase type 12 n=1 Tax=Solibacter usitatus (strain Ellin6076) TaxID=234267 RepID=Q01QK4_SOLUE